MYTGCPRRNVPDFGRVFLMLKCTDITQNTYVQSWTITEIMAREKCGLLAGPRTVPVSWQTYPFLSLSVVSYYCKSAHSSHWTAHVLPSGWMQCRLRLHCEWLVGKLLTCLLCFPTWNTVTFILCMDFAMAMLLLLLKNTKGVFPIEGFRLEVYLREFTRHCATG